MARRAKKTGYRLKGPAFVAAIAATCLLPAFGHAAALLSGSFEGAAFDSGLFTPPFGNFDGSRITGTFLLDLTGCSVIVGPGPQTGGCFAADTSFLKPLVPGQSIVYGEPGTFVNVVNTASAQRLIITFGYTNPYVEADLELVGGANAFIDGADYGSLHPGRVDLTRSTLLLKGGRSYVTSMALSSLTFDNAAPVPDAPTWAMLLFGFAFTGMAVRARGRRAAPVGSGLTP